MRRIGPRVLPLVLFGLLLVLSFLGIVAGVSSYLLLRAGYGPLVWGLLPPLVLLALVLILGATLWWALGSPMPGAGRRGARGSGEEPGKGPSREDRTDDV